MSMGEHSGNYNGKDSTYYPTPQQQAQLQLQDLLKQLSQPADFSSTLDGIYGPQEQALALAQQQAMQRATQGDSKLKGMYAGLQSQIKGQAGGIDKRYQGAKKENNSAYQQAIAGTAGAYDKSQNELSALADSLGLSAATPDVLARSESDQNMLQGLLRATNLSGQNRLTQNDQAALDYNTAQVGITGLAGNEARAGLQNSLQNTLAQLQQQGLGIQGQRAQTEWQMQQQDMQMRQQQQSDLLKSIVGSTQQQLDPLQQLTLQQKQLDSMGPLGPVYAAAGQAFGNSAGDVVSLINSVGAKQQFGDPFQFVQEVINANAARAHNGQPTYPEEQLRQIAAYYFKQMGGRSGFGGVEPYNAGQGFGG